MLDSAKVRPLISESQIDRRIDELAAQIDRDYEGKTIVAIGILQGCFIFQADLLRRLKAPSRCEFLALSNYASPPPASGEMRILLDIEETLEGKDLLIIDDLVESGVTLRFLQRTLKARRPASLKTCALLVRRQSSPREEPLDYVGFEIGQEFVVGYGIDHEGQHRGLRYIGMKEVS